VVTATSLSSAAGGLKLICYDLESCGLKLQEVLHWCMCVFPQFWSLVPRVGAAGSLTSKPCLEKKGIPRSVVSSSLRVYWDIHRVAAGSPWFRNALQIQRAFLVPRESEVLNREEIESG